MLPSQFHLSVCHNSGARLMAWTVEIIEMRFASYDTSRRPWSVNEASCSFLPWRCLTLIFAPTGFVLVDQIVIGWRLDTRICNARCTVVDSDIRPPPIIHHGPQNQTLPISSMAVLQCAVSGDPAPMVRWYKNGRLLTLAEHRFLLRDTGSLQIGGKLAFMFISSLFTKYMVATFSMEKRKSNYQKRTHTKVTQQKYEQE